MAKQIEIRFYADIENNHTTFKDIEQFLYYQFGNYCNVKRVDLLNESED